MPPPKKQLRHLDPSKLSPTMQKLNPHLFLGDVIGERIKEDMKEIASAEKKTGKRRSAMNKTESRFARLLEARVARGEIESFEYEGLTLRWPDGMRYTPDFVVVDATLSADAASAQSPSVCITLIEVKGAYGWAKDIVRFRAARDKWGNRYRFEFWQEVDGKWKETR